jgi:hypothetical protein
MLTTRRYRRQRESGGQNFDWRAHGRHGRFGQGPGSQGAGEERWRGAAGQADARTSIRNREERCGEAVERLADFEVQSLILRKGKWSRCHA